LNRTRPWRIVFFGGGRFARPALEALARGADEVTLVVAPPAAPAGRGRRLRPSPAAEAAERLGLPVLPTRSARAEATLRAVADQRPDLLVVAAFGGFLPPALLNLAPWPPLNLHPSLLPRHRGPAPVNWSLIHGDREVGVSLIFLEEAMDAGPILRQRAFPVTGPDSAGAWENRLAEAGAEELLAALAEMKSGRVRVRPQEPALVTINPLLRKTDGRLDFSRPAAALAGLINGVDPWPGAVAALGGRAVKIFGASPAAGHRTSAEPGRVLGLDEHGRLLAAVGAGGTLALAEFQPEGKKRLPAAEFLRGYRPEILSSEV
jgi:methionyl-tRNA formyltransferase